jgi:tRNA threonylcarbamoyladenosine biosynthesis protein TsaB
LSYLFVDSTYDITLGILDDDFRWIEFKKFTGQKASIILQTETHKLFELHGLKAKDIKGLFTIAGPGFYTGLRLSEGLSDVFKFFNIPHISFYSYEVPWWCGHKKGAWFTKAYRGEYFLHRWREQDVSSELIDVKNVQEKLMSLEVPLFIHGESSLDKLSLDAIKSSTSSMELLKTNSQNIFSLLWKNQTTRESFYFRAPEDEFRVSTP